MNKKPFIPSTYERIENTSKSTLITKILDYALPRRMKRLIFVSSFIAHLKNIDNPDLDLLVKINTLLYLSNREQALILPFKLHKNIWSQVDLMNVLNLNGVNAQSISEIKFYEIKNEKLRLISEDLIQVIPKWLMYGSQKQIKNDLVCIMKNYNNLCTI